MKPAAQRRVEREINDIVRNDGDNCSICRAPFKHNSRTFGGVDKAGQSVLAGECCERRVAKVILSGLFLDGKVDDLVSPLPTTGGGSPDPASAERGIAAVQQLFAQRQGEGSDLLRRAGLPAGRAKVFRQQTAWKDDDARWFERHPKRSHRLRPLIGDEAKVSGYETKRSVPDRHELQVLVRQIEPGKRTRLPFYRNLDIPIPDDETVLHSLFDIVAGDGREGETISMEMMRDAIGRHEIPGSGRPS